MNSIAKLTEFCLTVGKRKYKTLRKCWFIHLRPSKKYHKFQVTKNVGILSLIRLFFGGWIFPDISRTHTAYIGEDSSILGTTEYVW